MNLFGKSQEEKEADEYDRLSKEDLEQRLEMQDRQLIEESRRQVEDLVGMNLEIIKPTKIEIKKAEKTIIPSKFHTMLTQDLKLSKIEQEDINIVCLYLSLVNHLIDMGLDETALVFHQELEGFLAVHSSVDGFERRMLVTAITQLQKSTAQQQQKKII